MRDEPIEFCVMQAGRGEAAAFAELIRRCERIVLSVAFAELNDAHLVGDVTQETFLRAWRKLAELRRPEAFEGWVCGIARNLAQDFRRKRSAANQVHEGLQERVTTRSAPEPDAALQDDEQRQRIAAALEQLDADTRAIIVLRYYENLPSRRIGEILSMSPSAVDMRLSRGRRQLRESLGDGADSPAKPAGKISQTANMISEVTP